MDLTTPQTFLDWRARQDVFSGLAAVAYAEISLKREGGALPENVRAQRVTADFFTILRTPLLLGHPFSGDDELSGRAPVAVISYTLWQRRFGGRADAVGEFLPGQLASFEIVGVMPPGFTYPVDTYWAGVTEPIDIWVPLDQRTQEIGIRVALGTSPSAILMSVLGRASLHMICGLVIGLASAWGLAELVRGFLFEVQPHDPVVYAGAVTLIALTGLTASFLPARHAHEPWTPSSLCGWNNGIRVVVSGRPRGKRTPLVPIKAAGAKVGEAVGDGEGGRCRCRRCLDRRGILTLAHRGVTDVRGKDCVHPTSFLSSSG